jgi:hypothetical protein
MSSDRRRKIDADFDAKVGDAVTAVARIKGLTKETSDAIKAEILGVAQ